MSQAQTPPLDLEPITATANRFAALKMYSEAAELFEMALRLDPGNRGVQLALARVRKELKEELGVHERDVEAEVARRFKRNAIDACHFFGLGALYEERGKPQLASECLEIALAKEPIHPFAFKLQGKLLHREGRFDDARSMLRTAQRFNPFDRDIAELLGHVEIERGNDREALDATVDAYLLLREDHLEDAARLKERIRSLKSSLGIDGQAIVELFRERRIKLQTAFDRLELQRERHLQRQARAETSAEPQLGRIDLAGQLRQLHAFRRLNDELIFLLTRVSRREVFSDGSQIFSFGDRGRDLYLLEAGRIVISRPTPYGNFTLARLEEGTLFGEVNFISAVKRSGDARAEGEVRILRLDARGLDGLIQERADLGVEIYSAFWADLARKLRAANEQLRTFFTADDGGSSLAALRTRSDGDEVDLDAADKLELLREQGLSGSELQTLADFSNTRRFAGGSFLFHEGDDGQDMYVVLEGKVMISKYIPGGGEEALAILERGDFFGEMSLIDGAPRSADAKAYQGTATVIAFDQQTLEEVREVDPRASVDFIRLLCRLMAKRLREIDEKVTSWRIMSGQRGDLDSAETASTAQLLLAELPPDASRDDSPTGVFRPEELRQRADAARAAGEEPFPPDPADELAPSTASLSAG
ncbi:MAG: cyclic nucleotide-binding domain-containing protein [Acidobacteriota bacterium]